MYDYVTANIGNVAADGQPHDLVARGSAFYSITLVRLPSPFLTTDPATGDLIGRVFMHIGGSGAPGIRLSREGVSWVAPRGPDGSTIAQSDGVYLSCPDGNALSIKGLEFYLDTPG